LAIGHLSCKERGPLCSIFFIDKGGNIAPLQQDLSAITGQERRDRMRIKKGLIILILLIILAEFLPGRIVADQSSSLWQKVILRIDDGPHIKETPRLLEILAALSIKNARFNLIGRHIEQNGRISPRISKVIKQIIEMGYAIGIHTYNHPSQKSLSQYNRWELAQEIIKTQQAINRALAQEGRGPYFALSFATPGGLSSLPTNLRLVVDNFYNPSHPDSVYSILGIKHLTEIYPQITEAQIKELTEKWQGTKDDHWHIDTQDSNTNRLTPNQMVILLEKEFSKRNRVIVLIHDRKGNWPEDLEKIDLLWKKKSQKQKD